MTEYNIKFDPQNKTIRVPRGTDLLSAAVRCGIILNASCGGEGLCGKCRVVIKKGKAKFEPSRLLSDADRKNGVVLACQSIVEGDLEVMIPKESLGMHERLSHQAEEFTKGVVLKREGRFAYSPLVRKVYTELPHPTIDDNASDMARIVRDLESKLDGERISTRLANIRHLGEMIRQSDFKVTCVLGYKDDHMEMLSIEPGDTTKANFGFAFDIGTTTVVGQLIDLNTKEILGTRIAFNKQASYGSDVITRIIYALEPSGLEKLNEAVLDNIDEIIEDLVRVANINLSDIYAVSCAGNMTMMHLLLKVDPSSIRKAPYVPVSTVFSTAHTSEIGLGANPKGIISFLPGVASYIGGDIVSGILACGLSDDDEMSILADIGTNGEIVLGNREWMIGAAASAGPAFEGSGLEHGMKAVKGAIEKVSIGPDMELETRTIGDKSPKGICGSGYIDLLCQMLKRNLVTKDGKINRDIKSRRIRSSQDDRMEFVVAFKDETAIGRDITIREDDIENLKRAKGAIYSAVITLLNKVEKDISDVKKIYIAGGFGNYLNIENSIYIGLLPDTDREKYEFIGNSSLAGARMALLSHEAFEAAYRLYKNITYVDLSGEPSYMDEYIAALFFPHTDIRRFPSAQLSR